MPEGRPGHYHNAISVTVPPNTVAGSPFIVPFTPAAGWYTLEEIRIRVPAGVASLAGIAIVWNNFWVLPWNQPNTYYQTDDENIPLPFDFVMSGAFQIRGINADTVFPHTFLVYTSVADYFSANTGSQQAYGSPVAVTAG